VKKNDLTLLIKYDHQNQNTTRMRNSDTDGEKTRNKGQAYSRLNQTSWRWVLKVLLQY